MSIARAEVAHLARLSRLALTDDELDHFAVQLDQIISAVAHVQEVAAEGMPLLLRPGPRMAPCPLTAPKWPTWPGYRDWP